jgi:uncharacterized protein (TIGR00251 family)
MRRRGYHRAVPLDLDAAVTEVPAGVRLAVRAQPRASREGIVGVIDDGTGGVALKVAVTAPPVEGEANAALVKLLAKLLGVPKRDVRVVSGESGRTKRIEIARVDRATVLGCLRSALK